MTRGEKSHLEPVSADVEDAGSLASNGARLGLGRGTLREPCGGNHTVTHSIKLINDILYIMRVVLPCGPLLG